MPEVERVPEDQADEAPYPGPPYWVPDASGLIPVPNPLLTRAAQLRLERYIANTVNPDGYERTDSR